MRQQAVLGGLVAGLAGVAAMTAAEKLEQAITHRPNSYVPAHTLERLLRLPHKPDSQPPGSQLGHALGPRYPARSDTGTHGGARVARSSRLIPLPQPAAPE
jgi:hypothetical protein